MTNVIFFSCKGKIIYRFSYTFGQGCTCSLFIESFFFRLSFYLKKNSNAQLMAQYTFSKQVICTSLWE
jgi:hypothetical protein